MAIPKESFGRIKRIDTNSSENLLKAIRANSCNSRLIEFFCGIPFPIFKRKRPLNFSANLFTFAGRLEPQFEGAKRWHDFSN